MEEDVPSPIRERRLRKVAEVPIFSNDSFSERGSQRGVKATSSKERKASARRHKKLSYSALQLDLENHVILGLTLAGVGSSLLTTVFGVFHVDLFLTAYELPLPTYRFGNVVFSIINTASDLVGAWIVDHVATRRRRTDLVALSGILFALCFLTPFFRPWAGGSSTSWNGLHFILSLSLYDALNSFTTILLGAVFTDDHHMTEKDRVQFMASGKVVDLLVSFGVTRIGLALFDTTDLTHFRVFLGVLVAAVCVLFIAGQAKIHGSTGHGLASLRHLIAPPPSTKRIIVLESNSEHTVDRGGEGGVVENDTIVYDSLATASAHDFVTLHWRTVVKDFWSHDNFRAWIGMELFLEAQMTFVSFFLKTFVDGLLREAAVPVDPQACDWFISMIQPLTQVASILMYIPIRKFGYPRVYTVIICFNTVLSALVWKLADETSTAWIMVYMFFFPVVTGGIQSAGFHLAMADMVTELKLDHALAGRFGEPSLAGLFMGANALVCKPMQSLLPIIAATVLDRKGDSAETLFSLLVLPPLSCSIIQLVSWSRYNLSPERTARMRKELKELLTRTDSNQEILG